MGLPHHSGRIDERNVYRVSHPEGVDVSAGGEQEHLASGVAGQEPSQARAKAHSQPKGAEALAGKGLVAPQAGPRRGAASAMA